MPDPVIAEAIKLRDRLLDCAKEFRLKGKASTHPATKEMAEHDAKACEDAAKMLQKLGTEVDRLRLCIQHWDYGRLDRRALVRVTENWNDDPKESAS